MRRAKTRMLDCKLCWPGSGKPAVPIVYGKTNWYNYY